MFFLSTLTTAAWLALLPAPPLSPAPPLPACEPRLIQGQTLYCCTNPDGMQCCSESVTEDGVVNGCGCSQ